MYCYSKHETENMTAKLISLGFPKEHIWTYHGSIRSSERGRIQAEWMKVGGLIVVTVAFGLGVTFAPSSSFPNLH
jgi:superfamily II DNA helicase RecQ